MTSRHRRNGVFRIAPGPAQLDRNAPARAGGAGCRGRSIVERLRGPGSVRMTTDETLALTRGDHWPFSSTATSGSMS